VYITGAVLHHFRNLGKLYSEILRSSFGRPPFGENFRDRVVLSRQIEPYYEVEALITAIIRTYETARYILWSAFSPGKDTPTNFEDVLTHANLRMPETLNAKVQMWLKNL